MKKVLAIVCVLLYSITYSQLSLIETHQSPSCYGGCNGTIGITPNNAVGAVTYTWLPTGTLNYSLCAGQYTVLAEDAGANTASLSVTISNPTQMTASVVAQNTINCNCTGSATVFVTGGSAPYNYVWNSPFATPLPQITNLCPGITQVSVTDINGCLVTQSVTILPAPVPTIAVSVTNAACQGNCSGTASATVTGGTGGCTFQWNGPGIAAGVNTANPIGICPGFYTLTVTDALGCASSNMVNVSTVNSIPNASVTNTIYNETCLYSGDGAIDISIIGSNPGPFTYQWNNGASTQDITNIPSGVFSVSITDGIGNCTTINNVVSSIGTNCGTIQGNVYIDNNADCNKNLGDNNFSNALIVINPGNRFGYANANGDYSVNNLPFGTYSASVQHSFGLIFPTCTTTVNATVNSGTPNATANNLSVGFNSIIQPDLSVSGWSQGIVPGFTCRMNYYLTNLNNVSSSGIYKAILPSAFIPNITNASPLTYTLSGDTILWNFTNVIYIGGQIHFSVDFTTPLTIPLGSNFSTCMLAQPIATDLNYANNTTCYNRFVTGSFDPNDKTASPAGLGPNGDIAATETELTYLIRFQNTGNGPAVNIVVKDTLSPNVDITTFEMLGSSHNYNMDIMTGNVLRWKFNNIMLPDSNNNEPASHGYIHYRIKRNNNNAPGTQIKNTAYIYFDFNEPVVTNTAINTIETITGIQSQSMANDQWLVYPNPSTGLLTVINNNIAPDTKLKIEVLNSFGQLVLEETAVSNHKTLDISKFSNGVYFVKIVSDKQSSAKRVVLSK
ncbi:MAG: T9SS type A sorting domain-containing protein [Bacteroidota bacterium]